MLSVPPLNSIARSWRILQHHELTMLATGETHSVRSFVEAAFRCVGKEIVWKGEGIGALGRERRSSQR
ncbi:GDP-mannose 4,6-dehydratase [Mesorhizobium delmotii]|uniref:NAD(P)-binding domain-containing protein n=1 Tax=Mesorhizobium delmotii TaxID=1631247 RepID=A0A2P9AT31_9HYPH|nr:hypothetical protein BQ8482_400022 [Mesorhizobium delmotii]